MAADPRRDEPSRPDLPRPDLPRPDLPRPDRSGPGPGSEAGRHAGDRRDDRRDDEVARPRMEHFLAEAIEAERATGRAEETVEEAKRHLLVRLVRIIAGAVLVVVGLILMVLPGPGLVVVVAGLVLLAQDVPFARRLLDVARDRLPQDESGKLPRSTIALMVAGCTLGLSASIWWTFLRN